MHVRGSTGRPHPHVSAGAVRWVTEGDRGAPKPAPKASIFAFDISESSLPAERLSHFDFFGSEE
eukprot:scaffold508_cov95-Pinguiococcus_pyrenoidosus.AAC.1